MLIVVAGATNHLSRQLVQIFTERGAEIVPVGFETQKLSDVIQTASSEKYPDVHHRPSEVNTVLYFGAMNDERGSDDEHHYRVNAELPAEFCRIAAEAGVRKFIYVSSVHALDNHNVSSYAVSKRLAAEKLAAIEGVDTRVLYLPAVVGGELAGNLRHVMRLPKLLRAPALSVLSALKPTVHVSRVAEAIIEHEPEAGQRFTQRIIADPVSTKTPYAVVKRVFDLAFSIAILLFLGWAMALIWIAVKLGSAGPGIFRQERVGLNERTFICLKFRTMVTSAPNVGTHEVPVSFVTPLGGFLRRTKLDELPQVINIIRNEMSLVGPRPCLPSQSELIQERRSRGIFELRPGITGLAQVRGIDMSDPVRLAVCDQEYAQLQSLALEAEIIMQTVKGAGSGDNVGGGQQKA